MPGSRSSDQEHYRPDLRKEDLGRLISQWLGWGTLAADRFREAQPANLPRSWLGWPDLTAFANIPDVHKLGMIP